MWTYSMHVKCLIFMTHLPQIRTGTKAQRLESWPNAPGHFKNLPTDATGSRTTRSPQIVFLRAKCTRWHFWT